MSELIFAWTVYALNQLFLAVLFLALFLGELIKAY